MADCCVTQAGYDVGKCVVTECLWPRVKRHFDYWCCFRDNVQCLGDEIGFLEREQNKMDQKIEGARLRAEIPTTEIKNWLEDGTKKLEDAAMILRGCEELKAWNIISRCTWGKRAKKTAERIAQLRNGVNEISISDPAPPPAMSPIPYKTTMEFKSRNRVEDDIMEFLRDDRTFMIAICGAGGIGKTTMVHRIEDRVHKVLFDEVVLVVVSQPVVIFKIQMEIAELLGLKFSEGTLAARAHKLRIRLQDSKRKLIIFDDVWESFKPEDIGVAFENGFTKCKIILTSRITDACNKMGAEIIRMELLKEEEAWALFKEKAGSCVEGPDLRPIAENVVAECKRLPVALVTVGVALKDQSIDVWKDSLSQLRRSMPIDIYDVIKDVYKPLKLSYDFLENESAKSFFLLCCLFREDYNIPMGHLTLYGFGLGMLQGIRNIEEGRSRTRSVVEKLKSRFLLLDGDEGHSVKMHDVVRDVAIFIGSKEKDGFLMNSLEAFSLDSSSKDSSRNCNWMSIDISTENAKLPVGSDFPNLRFMMIQGVPKKAVDGNNAICFEGMQGLKVLSISDVYIRSLPSTMKSLKELRTLRLESCIVKDISVLGELACLEILCIRGCRNIEELPTDIGRLNVLRLLELSFCSRLKRVAAGVISSLDRLEELMIVGCFDKWEAKGNQSEERNAGLSELESLPNLTSLEIEISDCNLLAEEICLSHKLVRYKIRSGGPFYLSEEYEREISLYVPGDITVGNWIRQLARSTQSLVLEGELSTQFPVKLAELEEIIYGTIPEVSNFIQKLESICLENLPKLAHLWKSQNQNVSLGNLKSISIEGCPNLCYLFSVATARSLVQLERLEIKDCVKIEQVFWNEMESNTDASIIVFPNLKELRLSNLPNLAAFSQGVETIEFPKLEEMRIGKLPRLKSLLAATHDDHHSPYLFCNAKNVSLGNLKSIAIKGCANLCYLFSVATARSLVQLERLEIKDCDKIEQVFWNEMESNIDASIIEFPNLQRLTLSNLPKLAHLWKCQNQNVSLGNLKSISIEGCPNLCYLFSVATARSLVQLERLEIKDCVKIEQVFWNEMESNTDASIIEFPNLGWLTLSNLPNLAAFSQGVEIIESLHQLTRLTIKDCPKLRTKIGKCPNLRFVKFKNFSGSQHLSCSHHMIEELVIKNCDSTEEILWNGMESNTDASIIVFPNLQELRLSNLPNLAAFSQGVEIIESLHQLTRLEIKDCPKLRTKIGRCPKLTFVKFKNFSGSQHLPCSRRTIEELVISDCDTIEEILWDEIKDERERHIKFPELKKMELNNLPCYTTFCRGVESMEFPKLERMTIGNLPRLNSLLPLDLVEPTHGDHHSPHFFCNAKVEIPSLKDLSLINLQNTISKIWYRHVPINFFHNLESLHIYDVDGISNLISSSIAENLVNLNELSIERCQDMVDVIEDDEEAFATTLFPNLEALYIETLHKMRSFCQWKHALELPSLRHVTIEDCPVMETFTLGSLSTPSLSDFHIDDKQIETKDLNGGLRDWFRIKTENKEEHEDEDNKKAEGEEKIE